MDSMKNLSKKDGWYISEERQWEYDMYGFYPRGLGDIIYNTLRKIIETNDTSKWAYTVFDKCTVLLIQGKRWPDEMHPEQSTPISLIRWATKNMHKWGWIEKAKYRSQTSMTRDPWILYYAACIHLNKRAFINLYPPVRRYRPVLWELRKALLHKKNSYTFWNKVGDLLAKVFPRKDYVEILNYYRNWSYDRKDT